VRSSPNPRSSTEGYALTEAPDRFTGVLAGACIPSLPEKEAVMSKIPPAMWEDPEAFEPDEVREAAESDPEDQVPKRPIEEDEEELED
jgi:hypothetical protein